MVTGGLPATDGAAAVVGTRGKLDYGHEERNGVHEEEEQLTRSAEDSTARLGEVGSGGGMRNWAAAGVGNGDAIRRFQTLPASACA